MKLYLVYVRFIIIGNIYRSGIRAKQQYNLVPSILGVELKLDRIHSKVVAKAHQKYTHIVLPMPIYNGTLLFLVLKCKRTTNFNQQRSFKSDKQTIRNARV